MSIATLKKKTKFGGASSRMDPISGKGSYGFSLNGTHRNIGGVGQFRLVSNVTRTPFRGNDPMGSGGCCGIYINKPLNSGSCLTNSNEIVKKSSLNTSGMIDTKYKWVKSKYPRFWVQQDSQGYNSTNTQGQYLREKTNESGGNCGTFINVQSSGNCGKTIVSSQTDHVYTCTSGNACSYFIGTKKYIRMPYAKNLNQPAMSQGQYIGTGGVTRKQCLPTPPNMQPFPMNLVHNQGVESCNSNYKTWEEAQKAGLLPPDYVG
jgi:hypothetical protein